MNKKTKIFFLGMLLSLPTITNAELPKINGTCVVVNMNCQIIWEPNTMGGIHRTPPQIPAVFFDSSTSMVYFENPCYECTLELVIPGTDTVAYTYSIPDGDDTVQLPTNLSGQYELHIHRGNYCFFGEIEL